MSEVKFRKEVFRVGQRVRPSPEGIEANIFPGVFRGLPRAERSGVVVSVDRFNSPTVLWDDMRTPQSFAPWFITRDRRRRPSP